MPRAHSTAHCAQITLLATAVEKGKNVRLRIFHLDPADTYLDAGGARHAYRKRKRGRRGAEYGQQIGPADPVRLAGDQQPLAADEEWVVPDRKPAQVRASPAKKNPSRDPSQRSARTIGRLFDDRGLSDRARQTAEGSGARRATEAEAAIADARRGQREAEDRAAAAERETERVKKAPAMSAERLRDNPHLQKKIDAHTGIKSYAVWRAVVGMMRVYYPEGLRPFDNALTSTNADSLNAAMAKNVATRCPTEPGYVPERTAVKAALRSGLAANPSYPGLAAAADRSAPAAGPSAASLPTADAPAQSQTGTHAAAAATEALAHAAREVAESGSAPGASVAPAAARPRKRKPGGGRKPGSGRKLSLEDSMLLVARVLKFGCTVQQAAGDFGVDETTAGRVFKTTVRAWAEMLKREMPQPTKEEIERTTPAGYKKLLRRSDAQAMADATNVPLHHASNPELARSMWSQYYKQYCTVGCPCTLPLLNWLCFSDRDSSLLAAQCDSGLFCGQVFQIVITPGGYGMFSSCGQSPKLTDAEQIVLSGLLRFLYPGGCLVLDRGYAGLRQYSEKFGLRVAMPAYRIRLKAGQKKKDRTQMSRESCRHSRRVAKVRSHNEREMRRVKVYRFLKQPVPFEYKDILSDIVWIAVALGNLKVPLVESNAWGIETEAEAEESESERLAAALVGPLAAVV